jgi:ABC-2 type transport system permease protein
MNELLIIVEREFLERVRTRAFVIGTLLFPLFMIGILLLPMVVEDSGQPRRVAVVDGAPAGVGNIFVEMLERREADENGAVTAASYMVERLTGAASRDSLNTRVMAEELDAYVILGDDILTSGEVTLRARNITNRILLRDIRVAATTAVQAQRLGAAGLQPEAIARLMDPVAVNTARITERGEEGGDATATFFVAYTLSFLMYFIIAMYGHSVMRSVIQEKVTRISEILVSTVRAVRLMAGKITGVSAAALLQIAIWAALVVVVVSQSAFLRERFGVSESTLEAFRIDPGIAVVLLALFVVGFLLYAALFAALGAAMSSEQEAQPFQMVLMLPLLVPLLFLGAITSEPNGTIASFLGYFPLTAPVALPIRLAAAPVDWSQVALSLGGMLLAGMAIAWIAGKIYRAGILATGKKASLSELVRWVRAA